MITGIILFVIFLPLIIFIIVIVSICNTSSNTRENVRQLNEIKENVNSIANKKDFEGYEVTINDSDICLGRQRFSDSEGIEKYQELRRIFEKYNTSYKANLEYKEN